MIETKSFELAEYAKGNPNSSRLAIVLPGRLDTKDYIHIKSLVDALAEQGYYALSFDAPGTWESPGGIELYTTTSTLKAINELIEYLGNKPTVLAGHSRGGSNAMLGGTQNKYVTHIISIMSHCGPSSIVIPKKVKTSCRDLPPGTERTKEQKQFVLPLNYFTDQSKYDALPALKVCAKPKLFFYGSNDVLVDEDEVRETYNASAEPKTIHCLKAEHDYRLHPEIISEVNESVIKFLNESYS